MNDTDREAIRELNIAQAEAEEDNPQWAMQMREVLRQRMPIEEPTPQLEVIEGRNNSGITDAAVALQFKSLQAELRHSINKLNEHIDASKKSRANRL